MSHNPNAQQMDQPAGSDTSPSYQSIVIAKAAGNGIKRDQASPDFTWRDIIGLVQPDAAGTNSPTVTSFRGDVRGWQYAATDKIDCVYHIPHDYELGSDLYIHPHWGHNASSISGNFVLDVAASYASRNAAAPFAAFGAPISAQVSITGLTIGNYPQYCHVVSEIQLSASGGAGGLLDTDAIEVDGLILVTYTYSGTMSDDPFIFTGDIHYKSTNIGTVNKDPDFYA